MIKKLSSASIVVRTCQEALLCLRATWLAPPALRRHCSPVEQQPSIACPREELCGPGAPRQALPIHGKGASITVRTCQSHPPLGSTLLPRSDPASPTRLWKMPRCLKEGPPTLPALRKHLTAAPGQILPGHGECTSTTKKKNTSKMKKLRTIPS